MLTDHDAHAPPTTGQFAYNSWKPGTSGFPGLGGTYVDPIYGETVRRLSITAPAQGGDRIYERNGWWNADATYFMHCKPGPLDLYILNATTGAEIVAWPTMPISSPLIEDTSFDPVDPDLYWWWSGTDLHTYRISTLTSTLVKTFPASLQSLGGSVDWIDRTGRYMVVRYSDAVHVWDRVADVIYTGSIPFPGVSISGWVGITPNASHVVLGEPDNQPANEHWSYALDNVNHVLDTSGKMFWDLCGAHSDVISPSDGKSYLVVFNCYSTPEYGSVYRADVTLSHPRAADGGFDEQRNSAFLLVSGIATPLTRIAHFSCASKAPGQDWVLWSVSGGSDDPFDGGVSPWYFGWSELMLINVLTGDLRRLCHTRSRNVDLAYDCIPKASLSWDGTKVAWVSNFNINAGTPPNSMDLYALATPSYAGTATAAGPSASGGGRVIRSRHARWR